MNRKLSLLQWVAIAALLLAENQLLAQCAAPVSLWLVPPQTSTALVLKWTSVPNATQYQLRYWDNANPADKTIVEDCGSAPFTLRGLQKSKTYSLQMRAKCSSGFSTWSTISTGNTLNSSGTCSNLPTGLSTMVGSSSILVNWTSSGSHTIRYRAGNSGDWLIPAGALSNQLPPFLISGLAPGPYEIQIKRNCSATAGTYQTITALIDYPCQTPNPPVVTPNIYGAFVDLPSAPGLVSYQIEYRLGNTGPWINGGNNIPPSLYLLSPPLNSNTTYEVRAQANCTNGNSAFSQPASFTTGQEAGPCLANKNAGKNMNAQDILRVDQHYNHPSRFTFGSMIGVNDGGLVFRSFQNEITNQITRLTKQLRIFHTMDEDFNLSLQNYALNIKPKNTIPEGTPAHMDRNKAFYTKYRLTHGFTNITSATEILQYDPQTWKEKIYRESDWSMSGPAGILMSYRNYTRKFINEFAPANGTPNQILSTNYQVGNELWDYPVKEDYHNMLLGAYDAFESEYGPKSAGGWRMKFVAGSFQAFRGSNCNSFLRDYSNCGSELNRHDHIGDYLEVSNCNLLRDLDAIDCHPYSFKPHTNTWTHPEDPESETWQIRSLAAWLYDNQNSNTGVLQNTQLWSTEYGFDSYGVGEKTQSAYLLRGLLLHSRYHFEKVFFYNAYDVARTTDQYYYGLYNSSGFWRLGTHPANNAWASPIEAHGATPKPAWFGMMDFKNRFGEHVFHKALVEDADAMVMLIAKPDSTDPYLVFWSPRYTNDNNINQDIALSKAISWAGAFNGGFKPESNWAQVFAETVEAGQAFEALSEPMCGSLTLNAIRRNPAFIRLVPCVDCPNITQAGTIVAPNPGMGGIPFDPGVISSSQPASGGATGTIVYQWQMSLDNSGYQDIPGATGLNYDPPALTQTTYFRRGAHRSTCADFLHTSPIIIGVGTACPTISSFKRFAHNMSGCNPAGDFYFEIVLNQVSMNEQITLDGLPGNGINIPLCLLNQVPFTPSSFQSNLNFAGPNKLLWQIKASNGSTQTLRLYYCWSDAYPNPVSQTTAYDMCAGITVACTEGGNVVDPELEERADSPEFQDDTAGEFSLAPNPGADFLTLNYTGKALAQANFKMVSVTGQVVLERQFSNVPKQANLNIETQNLPSGMYFVCFQWGAESKWMLWQRI